MTVTRLVVLGGDMRGEDLVGDVGLPTLLQPAEMVRAESGEHRKLLPT